MARDYERDFIRGRDQARLHIVTNGFACARANVAKYREIKKLPHELDWLEGYEHAVNRFAQIDGGKDGAK